MRLPRTKTRIQRPAAQRLDYVNVLVIGNQTDPHFAPLANWLAEQPITRISAPNATDALLAAGNASLEPHVIVLLQSRPGQFAPTEIAVLRRRWPLARFAAVVGSWCEGEPRSGRVLDGVYRIPWDAATSRIAAEFSELLTGRSKFSLPATATIEERSLFVEPVARRLTGLIAVAALRRTWAEPVMDALSAPGAATFYWPLDGSALARGIAAAVWDTSGCEDQLPYFRASLPKLPTGAPLVALADFPRPHDLVLLASLGITNVLGKPLSVGDLVGALAEKSATVEPIHSRSAA